MCREDEEEVLLTPPGLLALTLLVSAETRPPPPSRQPSLPAPQHSPAVAVGLSPGLDLELSEGRPCSFSAP